MAFSSSVELQGKIQSIASDIKDDLLASRINVEAFSIRDPLTAEACNYLISLLTSLEDKFDQRAEEHIKYVIAKQIQEEEDRVRKDRLTEYEEKIFEQRRIIADKEAFLENLLRPRRKRRENEKQAEFIVNKNAEKSTQEARRLLLLEDALAKAEKLKIELKQSMHNSERKTGLLSGKNVNDASMSISSIIPEIEAAKLRMEALNRGLPCQSNRDNKQNATQPLANKLVQQIQEINAQNKKRVQCMLVYEQLKNMLAFKRKQWRDLTKIYEQERQKLKEKKSIRKNLELERETVDNRCYSPLISETRRRSIGGC